MLAYADKQLTIFNTYAHPTDQPIDDVVCRVEEGEATAARRRRRGNQGKKDADGHQVPEHRSKTKAGRVYMYNNTIIMNE